jgi:electron transfer flavoprotein alpha/beta subunit
MKILVPVKRVVDYNIKIRIMADGLHKDTIRSVTPAKSPNKLVDLLAPT